MTNTGFDRRRYPFAPPCHQIDDYYGQLVADPFRYLEDLEDVRTSNWLKAQGHLTNEYFQSSPLKTTRDVVYQRLKTLWHYPKYSVLAKEGRAYFFWGLDLTTQSEVQNQAVLYRLDSLEDAPKLLLDPNQLDPTGRTSVTAQFFSPDGQLLAYAVSTGGSDWQEIRVRHALTGIDYPDSLENCKMTCVAWKADNSGFFYNRFWTAQQNALLETSGLFWHTLGTPQSEDQLIYTSPILSPQLNLYPQITDDGCYLLLSLLAGAEPTNRIYYRRVESDGPFIPLLDDNEARYIFLGNQGPIFYFQTDFHAPHGKVIAINTLFPQKENWRTIVAESEAVVDFGILAGGRLILTFLHHLHHTVKLYKLDGTFEGDLRLPVIGSVAGLTGRAGHEEILISVESFTTPPSVYCYNLAEGDLKLVFEPALAHRNESYETRQIFYPSKDGVFIPMFIICKKGLILDGHNPTLLSGYGGFGKSLTPSFSLSQQLWLKQGGVLAVANVRGGGEGGQKWHEAARRGNRQRAIDDFCQAAIWLTRHGYTSPKRLAAMGASNGGLLVAASAVQQPDLFGAVVCQAPLTDMLRYQLFGPGRSWLAEYGNAEQSQAEFEWLYAYSPLHNVKEVSHPAMLITVPLADERVHAMHGLKFAATLQAHDRGTNPILLRLDVDNGHGMGKPAGEVIEELADIYTFLFDALGIEVK